MKKLLSLIALVSLFAVSNASAFWGGRGGNCCRREVVCAEPVPAARVIQEPTEVGPKPRCTKTITRVVEAPATKICKTSCHYVCPNGYDEDGGDCA